MLEVSNRSKADVASSRHANALMGTRSSVVGPMMSSHPDECRAAELMLLSVVNVLPPHHAVSSRSGMMASRQFHCEAAVDGFRCPQG
jgi:hypothetical protein